MTGGSQLVTQRQGEPHRQAWTHEIVICPDSVFCGLTYSQANAARLVAEDGDPRERPWQDFPQDFPTDGAGLVLRA